MLWNLYLFSFTTFLEMDTAVFQLNLQQCNNFQRDVLIIDFFIAIQCFAYNKLILSFGDFRF
jgi:hypothetical protein